MATSPATFPNALTRPRRWLLLTIVSVGLLLITLDNSILYTALPTLTSELGASGTESLWIINAYPLVMAGLLPGSGTLGDRIGHRRMFLISLVAFGVASIAAAFAPSAVLLIAARALLAVGAAAMMPATLALIRTSFHDERERNIAIAVWGSVSVLGIALGPIISGALLEAFWWGSVFLINVPVVVAAIIATLLIAPQNDPDRSKRWDAVSSLQAMAALTAAVAPGDGRADGGGVPDQRARPDPAVVSGRRDLRRCLGDGGLAVRQAAAALGPPVARGLDLPQPRILLRSDRRLCGDVHPHRPTTGHHAAVPAHRRLTPLQAGLVVATIALGSRPSSLLGGAYLHLSGLRTPIAGGFALVLLGVIVTIIGFHTAFGMLLAGLALVGAGTGGAMSVASAAIVGNAPPAVPAWRRRSRRCRRSSAASSRSPSSGAWHPSSTPPPSASPTVHPRRLGVASSTR